MQRRVFENIFKKHYQVLVCFAVSRVGRFDIAEDIVQTFFIKLWEKEIDLPQDEYRIKLFLYKSVRNSIMDYYRNTYSKQQSMVDMDRSVEYADSRIKKLLEDEEYDIEVDIKFFERVKSLNDAIKRLPKKCSQIFMKIYMEEKDYATVAKEMNLSVNTVKVQMHRAYCKLRDMAL